MVFQSENRSGDFILGSVIPAKYCQKKYYSPMLRVVIPKSEGLPNLDILSMLFFRCFFPWDRRSQEGITTVDATQRAS